MASSPFASPRSMGFGDRSPSPQRRSTGRRRSSSSDSSNSGDEEGPIIERKQSGVHQTSPKTAGAESDDGRKEKAKVTRSPTLQKLAGGIVTLVEGHKAAKEKRDPDRKADEVKSLNVVKEKNEELPTAAEDKKAHQDPTHGGGVLPRKLSVAALIRSFSPRSRARAATAALPAEATEHVAENESAKPEQPKRKSTSRVTFGTLKRASLSFPASPRRASNDLTASAPTVPPIAPPPASPNDVSKCKQAVKAVTKDTPLLTIHIPPANPAPAPSISAVVTNESFATGPGSLVDDVRATLAKLLTLLDDVDPRKLRSIRLGGELRGLLGKAADEVDAYADAFRDHARASVGVAISLQNLAASLRQVFPIVEKLRTAKFLLNRQFKQDVTFAFQEINSYYTSVFMELSMAVATRAGLVLPMPTPVAPPFPPEEEEEEVKKDDAEKTEPVTVPISPPPPPDREPTGDDLCLAAHRHFFGHACPVNLTQARALYEQAASLNCTIAMRCLGHMYFHGKGVEKDLFVAEQWLTRAATSGDDVETWYLLGCLFCQQAPHQKTANRTRECLMRAMTQFTLAAERGLADAQFRLAEMLEHGDAVESLIDRVHAALPWYRRAAEQDHAKAEAALGRLLLCLYDDDVPPDQHRAIEAIHWLHRAVTKEENAEALTLLGLIFTSGERGVPRDLVRAEAFFRRGVRAGSHEAMLQLALLLLAPSNDATHDRVVAIDEALRLLLTAAQDGALAEANFQLGELLYNSILLRDRAAALRFYERAAHATTSHAVAARRAATMVYSGVGCKQVDKTRAYRLYTIAAEADDAEALNALGLMYEDGDGCDLDFQKAVSCYSRAVQLGSAHAHFNLGCLLAHGKGVARNLDAAQAHFNRALSLGYTLARDFLRPEA